MTAKTRAARRRVFHALKYASDRRGKILQRKFQYTGQNQNCELQLTQLIWYLVLSSVSMDHCSNDRKLHLSPERQASFLCFYIKERAMVCAFSLPRIDVVVVFCLERRENNISFTGMGSVRSIYSFHTSDIQAGKYWFRSTRCESHLFTESSQFSLASFAWEKRGSEEKAKEATRFRDLDIWNWPIEYRSDQTTVKYEPIPSIQWEM